MVTSASLAIGCFLLAVAASHGAAPKRVYNGDKVIRAIPATEQQLHLLNDLFRGDNALDDSGDTFVDFWMQPHSVGQAVDIYVRRDKLDAVTSFLRMARISFKITVDDLQALIDKVATEDKRRHKRQVPPDGARRFDAVVGRYSSYQEMLAWMSEQCAASPHLATCGSFGVSYEGREMRFLRLGRDRASPNAATEKRSIFIEGGIHAREWLAPATIIHFAHRLLTSYSTDSRVKAILDNFQFYIVPSINPDGYEYSRAHERLWRKTRSNTSSPLCQGVDGNRNFNIRWATTGSDPNPCSNLYHGPRPLSEPELKSMSDFITAHRQEWLAYFAIHSYSQLWLTPYGFEFGAKPVDYEELIRVAHIGGSALMAENGRLWRVGNTVNLTYLCSGSSDDWAKAIIGMKYSYTLELFPGESALTGFVVSEREIDNSGREVFAGVMAAVEAMRIPAEENQVDAIAFLTTNVPAFPEPLLIDPSEPSLDDPWSTIEVQQILTKLAFDVNVMMQRIDRVSAMCEADGDNLRHRAQRIEAELPRLDAQVRALSSHDTILWKAVASTQARQLMMQRQLLERTLLLVVTTAFVPHAVNKESLIGETLKLGNLSDAGVVEALRGLHIDHVSPRNARARRKWQSENGSPAQAIGEHVLELTRIRSKVRAMLLSARARNCTEKAGFWFEPQLGAEERFARRALDEQLAKLKAQVGDALTFELSLLRLKTSHGDFYYDTVSRLVYPSG